MTSNLFMKGWLEKKKSKASVFGSDTNKRWFIIDKMTPQLEMDGFDDKSEFTLSYFKSPHSHERCGWFFLADVRAILSDDVSRWITIELPNRKYHLRSSDHRQHDAWCVSLRSLCSKANEKQSTMLQFHLKSIPALPTISIKNGEEAMDQKQEAFRNQIEFLREINHDNKTLKDWPTIKEQIRLKAAEKKDCYLSSEETIHARVGRAILDPVKQTDTFDDNKREENLSLSDKEAKECESIIKECVVDDNCCTKDGSCPVAQKEETIKDFVYVAHVTQIENTQLFQKKVEFDVDSECSFLPDDNFVDENWDSSSSENNYA